MKRDVWLAPFKAGRWMYVIASMILVCMVCGGLFLTQNSSTKAASIPTIEYRQDTSRAMIFVNNPEQITTADLGDTAYGGNAISSYQLQAGAYRNFFEHVNRTGFTIGYGARLYNGSGSEVNVTIQGSGNVLNANGGVAFANMLNNYSAVGTSYRLANGASMWLIGGNGPNAFATVGASFFSGVVDFSVDGPVVVNNIAYRNRGSIAASTTYQGQISRIEPDGTDENRVYKGISNASAVSADATFTLDGSEELNTPLSVSYATYDVNAGAYNSPITSNGGWVTHISPGTNSQAIASDMVGFATREGVYLDPLTASDFSGRYPNLGNWGVVYRLSGTVTNTSSVNRTISVNLRSPGAGVAFAYQGSDGEWRSRTITANTTVSYYTLTVPAGQSVNLNASFVTGGPSAGNIMQTITVTA